MDSNQYKIIDDGLKPFEMALGEFVGAALNLRDTYSAYVSQNGGRDAIRAEIFYGSSTPEQYAVIFNNGSVMDFGRGINVLTTHRYSSMSIHLVDLFFENNEITIKDKDGNIKKGNMILSLENLVIGNEDYKEQ